MGRAAIVIGVTAALLAVPGQAGAVRPATEQEIAEFAVSAKVVENAQCARALKSSGGDSCPAPREGYEPTITEARVSTMDESWATADISPAPRSTEAATAIFRKQTEQAYGEAGPEPRSAWYMFLHGQGCEVGQNLGMTNGTVIGLMPDLVVAMGCTPIIPTKVRCLDKFRTSLLALEKPRQCAVAGPEDSLFPGWMNIRELKWRKWGNARQAVAIGVIRELPQSFRKNSSVSPSAPPVSTAMPLTPISVRLVASRMVPCGTAHFYSRMRVISPFGRFTVNLPTCPDQFFAPA